MWGSLVAVLGHRPGTSQRNRLRLACRLTWRPVRSLSDCPSAFIEPLSRHCHVPDSFIQSLISPRNPPSLLKMTQRVLNSELCRSSIEIPIEVDQLSFGKRLPSPAMDQGGGGAREAGSVPPRTLITCMHVRSPWHQDKGDDAEWGGA